MHKECVVLLVRNVLATATAAKEKETKGMERNESEKIPVLILAPGCSLISGLTRRRRLCWIALHLPSVIPIILRVTRVQVLITE